MRSCSLRPDLERVRKGSALRRVPALIPSLIEPGGRYTCPRRAPPPVRPPGRRSSRRAGPSYRTMLADWHATGTRDGIPARCSNGDCDGRVLIKPRRDDDAAIDKLARRWIESTRRSRERPGMACRPKSVWHLKNK
jgi:hypothetical protein